MPDAELECVAGGAAKLVRSATPRTGVFRMTPRVARMVPALGSECAAGVCRPG